MKKVLKWTGFVVAGLLGVALLGFAWIHFESERELDRQYAAADNAMLVVPADAVEIAEGRRMAQLAGCMHCHGDNLAGTVVDDIPTLVRLVAPNISTMLPDYSDAQLATMLRRGIKPNGKSVLFMPSEMFRNLRDEDLARVIAYLRSMPPVTEGITEKTKLRPIGRLIIATGDFKPAARTIELLPDADRHLDAADALSRGRYFTMNFCSECHGQDLRGVAPIHSPALAVARAYSLEQFTHLMQEGVGTGERQFKLMTPTSKARFTKFTPEEIADLHAYLQTL